MISEVKGFSAGSRRGRLPPNRFLPTILSAILLSACGGKSGNRSDGSTPVDAGDAGTVDPLSWSQPENLSNSTEISTIWCNWGNSIAVTSGGTVQVVWRELHDEQQGVDIARVVHRRKPGGGWDPVEDLTAVEDGIGHPKIAASDTHVYVAWHVFDPAGDDILRIRVSGADGQAGSFSAAQTIVSDAARGPFNPLGELSATPSIAAGGDWVHVVWSDDRMVTACGIQIAEVYLVSSGDRGTTWSSVMRASSDDCRSSWTPSAAVFGEHVHTAWTDERDKANDCGLGQGVCREEIYYRRLSGNGTSPDPSEIRMTDDPAGGEVESWAPSIAAWDEQVHLVWFDRSGGDDFEVYHLRSVDRGVTWGEPARQLSYHAPGCAAARPTAAGGGDEVHVVWLEHCGDTSSAVYHSWSPDRGATWSEPADIASGTSVFAVQPSVAFHDGTAHVVWTDLGEMYYAASR